MPGSGQVVPAGQVAAYSTPLARVEAEAVLLAVAGVLPEYR